MTLTLLAHEVPAAATANATANATDFGALFTTLRPRLLQLAQGIVRCPQAAEDVVQDAMFAALKSLASFRGRAAASTWLHRIVVNAALMHLRRSRSRREFSLEDLDESRPGSAVDPAVAAEQADACARLTECLEEMSPIHRNVIELRDIRGLSTSSVAATLGISENAAKIRLHRARRSLRGIFEAAGSPAGARRPAGRIVALPTAAETSGRLAG